MTEDDVVRIVRLYLESLFPKACSRCGRRFASLREYLQATTHLSTPVLYDDITGEIPSDPFGPMSFANCACGTTLAVGSRGIPTWQLIKLLTWAKSETSRRSIGIRELLCQIRDRIDEQVLTESSRNPVPRAHDRSSRTRFGHSRR
jgi:hypothetical protein